MHRSNTASQFDYLVVEDPLTSSFHKRIVEVAAAQRLLSLHGLRMQRITSATI